MAADKFDVTKHLAGLKPEDRDALTAHFAANGGGAALPAVDKAGAAFIDAKTQKVLGVNPANRPIGLTADDKWSGMFKSAAGASLAGQGGLRGSTPAEIAAFNNLGRPSNEMIQNFAGTGATMNTRYGTASSTIAAAPKSMVADHGSGNANLVTGAPNALLQGSPELYTLPTLKLPDLPQAVAALSKSAPAQPARGAAPLGDISRADMLTRNVNFTPAGPTPYTAPAVPASKGDGSLNSLIGSLKALIGGGTATYQPRKAAPVPLGDISRTAAAARNKPFEPRPPDPLFAWGSNTYR